jgi:Flp pilus assembly protein TadG
MSMHALRRLSEDSRGTSFVEIGMLAPFFAMLVLGTADASRAVVDKMMLQQAASRTIEMVSAGGLDSDAFDNLRSEAAAAAGVSTSQVTVDSWLECDRVRQASFDGECTNTEEIGRYTSVVISKAYQPWFASSLASLGYNISRTITLKGKASVRLQ